MALNRGDIAEAERLLPAIEVNTAEDFGLPLLAVLERGLEKLVPVLLAAGADPNRWLDQAPGPSTPLGMAAATEARGANRRRLTQLMLRHGADPNGRGFKGATPLHEAALFVAGGWGRLGGLKALLRAGTRLETRDDFGNTPWMLAALRAARSDPLLPPKRRRAAVVTVLEKAGADTSSLPSVELLLAGGQGDERRAIAALAEGADPRARTETGSPALFLAVKANAAGLVRTLLEAGSDPSIPDPLHGEGTTPLQLAEEKGLGEIAALLRSGETVENHQPTTS